MSRRTTNPTKPNAISIRLVFVIGWNERREFSHCICFATHLRIPVKSKQNVVLHVVVVVDDEDDDEDR